MSCWRAEPARIRSRRCPLLGLHLLGLLIRGGSTEKVKVDLEPLVDAGVNGVVLVADLLRGQTLLSGLVLRGRSVLVCAAHEQQVPAAQAAVPLRGKEHGVSRT